MRIPDLSQLFMDLVRVQVELWDAVDRRLRRDNNLTMAQFGVLRVVAATPACRVQDIADALSVTVGGVSKVVDRIEDAGLCARRPNPDDRRSSILDLTPAGLALHAAAAATLADELRIRFGAALPAHVLAQFADTLAAIRTATHPTEQTP